MYLLSSKMKGQAAPGAVLREETMPRDISATGQNGLFERAIWSINSADFHGIYSGYNGICNCIYIYICIHNTYIYIMDIYWIYKGQCVILSVTENDHLLMKIMINAIFWQNHSIRLPIRRKWSVWSYILWIVLVSCGCIGNPVLIPK